MLARGGRIPDLASSSSTLNLFQHCSHATARRARARAHSADQHMQPAPFTRQSRVHSPSMWSRLRNFGLPLSTSRRCLRLTGRRAIRPPVWPCFDCTLGACLSACSCSLSLFPSVGSQLPCSAFPHRRHCIQNPTGAPPGVLHPFELPGTCARLAFWPSIPSLLPARPDPTVRQPPAPPLLHPTPRRRPHRRRLRKASPPSSSQ